MRKIFYAESRQCKSCQADISARQLRCVFCVACSAKRKKAYERKKRRNRDQRLRAAGDVTSILRQRRTKATQRGLVFELTAETLPPIPTTCPVFKVPFGTHVGPPQLDRIDNSKGYVPGNVQWISGLANRIKNSATGLEILAVAKHTLKSELLR